MIKSASLFTTEIDDLDLAINQLKAQLSEKLTLMKNTVGIVQCDTEFVDEGIVPMMYEALGIPLVGGTTTSSATNVGVGKFAVSILVLTGNDVDFVVSCTSELKGDYWHEIKRSFEDTAAEFSGLQKHTPKLALVFPPINDEIAGDDYIDAIESACGDVPIFGTLFVDDSLGSFDKSAAIFNGETSRTKMPYVLIYGNVNPKFSIVTVPREEGLVYANAIITKASENIVYEINYKPAVKFFEEVGISKGKNLTNGAAFVPTILIMRNSMERDYFVRAMMKIEKDGSVSFRGRMYEGARIVIGSNAGADVMAESRKGVECIAADKDASAALIFSCIARQLLIFPNALAELDCIKNSFSGHIEFLASYSGGEFAPTSLDSNNAARNRFHNYSLIACLL